MTTVAHQNEFISIATICLCAKSNKTANIAEAIRLVRLAASAGASWILLPEIFAWQGPYSAIYEQAEFADGPLNQSLAALAKELNILLYAGSVGERPTSEDLKNHAATNAQGERRVFNTSYVFARDGALIAKYRKTHLFNLSDAKGSALYCEPQGFIPGDRPVSFTFEGFRCAMSTCYDLRFPLLYQSFLQQNEPIDVVFVPSAFTKKTGEAHWELLLRARAVEMQAYVVAANQTGEHAPGKESYGHSMIVDPWGLKLADTGPDTGFVMARLERSKLTEVRVRLPALINRRPELFG